MPSTVFIPKGQSLTVDGKTFKGRKYLIDGKPAQASVTTILEHKFGEGKFGAGAWWGMGVGAEGMLKLLDNPEVSPAFDKAKSKDDIVPLLTEYKLTTNHVRDQAGDRGTTIHKAAEVYAATGEAPRPKAFIKEQQGYVQALIKFLDEKQPVFIETEVVVGSAEHDYAGTFDARVVMDGRLGIIDYKTSRHIYLANFFQLAAYELASVECGYEPTDFQAVVRLGEDGEYEYEESKVTIQQWLDQLQAYRSEIAAKEARKA